MAEPLVSDEGIMAINNEYKNTIKILGPSLYKRIEAELIDSINSKRDTDQGNFSIQQFNFLETNIENCPPGLATFGDDGLAIKFPQQGALSIRFGFRARYEKGTIRSTDDYIITISDLSIYAPMRIKPDFSTGKILILEMQDPSINMNFRLQVENRWLKPIAKILTASIQSKLKDKIKDAINANRPARTQMAELSGKPIAFPQFFTHPSNTDGFIDIVKNIDKKIIEHHMPFDGTLVPVVMDTPSKESWGSAYSLGGNGNVGKVIEQGTHGDSAIWTGHYLGSLAFKYQALKDQETIEQIQKVLKSIERLFEVNGNSGLLSRYVAPVNSPAGKWMLNTKMGFRRKVIDGVEWISDQGGNGVSRDQYTGIFFGLTMAFNHVDDADIKNRSRKLLGIIINYLLKNNWILSEDRFRDIEGNKHKQMPATWAGINYQKLTILLIANHLFPENVTYSRELNKASALAETAWVSTFIGILDPISSYYGYNLNHTYLYTYFQLEKNLGRREQMIRSIKILEYYIGHHKNPYFDLIRSVILNKQDENYTNHIRNVFSMFLDRGHRDLIVPEMDPASMEQITVTFANGRKVEIPKYPLNPTQRHFTEEFIWQREPFFVPKVQGQNQNLNREAIGLDVTLPYWMGKFHGVF